MRFREKATNGHQMDCVVTNTQYLYIDNKYHIFIAIHRELWFHSSSNLSFRPFLVV